MALSRCAPLQKSLTKEKKWLNKELNLDLQIFEAVTYPLQHTGMNRSDGRNVVYRYKYQQQLERDLQDKHKKCVSHACTRKKSKFACVI